MTIGEIIDASTNSFDLIRIPIVVSQLRLIEVWDTSFEKNHASEKVRGLTSYAYYPELFIINSEFCK